jgi:hypothetical protein
MKNSTKSLALAAAFAGLLGGTTARVNAQPTPNATPSAQAGVLLAQAPDSTKHSCKGKNDCKGQGGCKSSDNGCKAKNSCKGKGGCATDGSKMPKLV